MPSSEFYIRDLKIIPNMKSSKKISLLILRGNFPGSSRSQHRQPISHLEEKVTDPSFLTLNSRYRYLFRMFEILFQHFPAAENTVPDQTPESPPLCCTDVREYPSRDKPWKGRNELFPPVSYFSPQNSPPAHRIPITFFARFTCSSVGGSTPSS